MTRAVALGMRRQQYVEAAELMGATEWWTLRKHIWSKVLPNVAVTSAQATGAALLVVASLSFLGLGVQPPTPSWGRSISAAIDWVSVDPAYLLFPGLALFAVTWGFNALGDGLRDALDPRQGKR